MADFMTDTDALRQSADSLSNIKRTIEGLSSSLSSINVKNFLDSEATPILMKKISSDVAKIDRYSSVVGQMSSTLHTISSTYAKTEKSIVGSVPNKTSIKNAQSGGSSGKGSNDITNNPAYKIIKAALGPAGLVVDAGIHAASGNPWNGGKIIGDLSNIAGGFVKNFDGSHIDWAKWFGFDYIKDPPMKYALGKYFNIDSVGKGVSAACRWIAAIAVSGFSNYKEHGGFTTRFFEETGVEAALKVGESILVTAGVAAVAGALVSAGVIAGAPAIAVTAVAAGVTVVVDAGLNALAKWCTKGEKTEWVEWFSDPICDTGEKIVDWAKDASQKAAQWTTNAAEGIGHAVSDGINSIKNTFLNIGGSGCKWGILG